MPKIGMEPIRRSALVDAAIGEVGRSGAAGVTVAQIAKAAGMSTALAHHYFGSKDQILIAAMRHILVVFGAEARSLLGAAETPRDRLRAVVATCFTPANFAPGIAAAWLDFYVLAQRSPDAARLLKVYHRRLQSNLVHALRPFAGEDAPEIAARAGALIDGLYLRAVLGSGRGDGAAAEAAVLAQIDAQLRSLS